MIRILPVILLLSACGGSSPKPPEPTTPPAPWHLVATIDPALRPYWDDYLANVATVEATVNQWAADHGRTLPTVPTTLLILGEWACAPAKWTSRRGPVSVSMRLCPDSCEDPEYQRGKRWMCGLSFELAMMLAECNDGAGGHCGDEHQPGWPGLRQPAAIDLERRLDALEWVGPRVRAGR